MKNINPTNTQAWKALEAHQSQLAHTTIADLFKQEENRFNDYSLTFENQILVDFSKNKINQETLKLLHQLAKESALDEAINAMFAGEKINRTENRAVLHTALRNRSNTPVTDTSLLKAIMVNADPRKVTTQIATSFAISSRVT